MITISQLTDNTQLEITYPQGDPNPTGDLVGRNVTFYPGKRIGPLMGVILEVTETAYIVRVTGGDGTSRKANRAELGKKWLCGKDVTAIMLF
jgi:hypothetical protein